MGAQNDGFVSREIAGLCFAAKIDYGSTICAASIGADKHHASGRGKRQERLIHLRSKATFFAHRSFPSWLS